MTAPAQDILDLPPHLTYAVHMVPAGANDEGAATTLVGVLYLEPGEAIDLDTMRALATADDGWVELVTTSTGLHVWCDEEGMMKGLPVNATASRLAGRVILGPALLCAHDGEGESVGLELPDLIHALSSAGVLTEEDLTAHPMHGGEA